MALDEIYPHNKNVVLLQPNYPITDEEVNLNVINEFQSRFDIIVGNLIIIIRAALYSIPFKGVENIFVDYWEKGLITRHHWHWTNSIFSETGS